MGLDLGAVNTPVITAIRYSPRNSSTGTVTNANFMIGGMFQVSNTADFSSGVTTLSTIPVAPAYNTYTSVAVPATTSTWRYVRYRTGTERNANISELEVYGGTIPAADGYEQWLASAGLPAGSAFDGDGNSDGIPDGVSYMIPSGLKPPDAVAGKLAAVIRQDAAVTVVLWKSSSLDGGWETVGLVPAADQTGVEVGFVLMEAEAVAPPAGGRVFYRASFRR